ncbi:hypothetical protein EXIGLDRAFT_765769 [Exidia glandulosa HHB12029]|uniref:Uncharacterized protein n=1 Tax=Exidia glandulosa HHB12029 TaxID=1314781 RepID=A0A165K8E2_EXIGL|nr:hypothetical protein EXIGLDRAFT_765769 [Exidia glandulosa HHB12029]
MGHFHATDEQRAWLECQVPEWAARSASDRSVRRKFVEECTQTYIQRWGLPETVPTENKLREKIRKWLNTCSRRKREAEKPFSLGIRDTLRHGKEQRRWLNSLIPEYEESGARRGGKTEFAYKCAETYIKRWGLPKTANGEELAEDDFKKRIHTWFRLGVHLSLSKRGPDHQVAAQQQVSSAEDIQQHRAPTSHNSQLLYEIGPHPAADNGSSSTTHAYGPTGFSGLTLPQHGATSSASRPDDNLPASPPPPDPLQLPSFCSSLSALQSPVLSYSPQSPSPPLDASTPPSPKSVSILLKDKGHGILLAQKLVELASGRELHANDVAAEIVASALGTVNIVEALFVAAGWVLDASRNSPGSTLPKEGEHVLTEPQRISDFNAMDCMDEFDPDLNVVWPPLFSSRPTTRASPPTCMLEDLLKSFVRVLSHCPANVKSEVLFELHETFRRRSVALISFSSQWSDTNTDSDRKHIAFAHILSTVLSLPSLFRDEANRDVWIVFAQVLVSVLPKGAEAEAGWVAGVYNLRALVELKVNARGASSDYEPKCRWEKEIFRVYEDRWLKMHDVRLQAELAEILDWLRGVLHFEALVG